MDFKKVEEVKNKIEEVKNKSFWNSLKMKIAFILVFGLPIVLFLDTFFSRLNNDKLQYSGEILELASSINPVVTKNAVFQQKSSKYAEKHKIGRTKGIIYSDSFVYLEEDNSTVTVQWHKYNNEDFLIDKISFDYKNKEKNKRSRSFN
jgi:hypothetical protein